MLSHVEEKHLMETKSPRFSRKIQQVKFSNGKKTPKKINHELEQIENTGRRIDQTKCTFCEEEIKKADSKMHIEACVKAAKNVNIDNNQCLICKVKFDATSEVFRHVKLEHPDEPKVINIDPSNQEYSTLQTPESMKKLCNEQKADDLYQPFEGIVK